MKADFLEVYTGAAPRTRFFAAWAPGKRSLFAGVRKKLRLMALGGAQQHGIYHKLFLEQP